MSRAGSEMVKGRQRDETLQDLVNPDFPAHHLTGALKLQKPACATHFKTYNNFVKCKLHSLSLDFPLLMSERRSNTFVLLCADQTAKMK